MCACVGGCKKKVIGLELICPGLVLLLFRICPPTSCVPAWNVCLLSADEAGDSANCSFTRITASTPKRGVRVTIPNLRLYLYLTFRPAIYIPTTLCPVSFLVYLAEPLLLPGSLPLTSSPLPQPLLPLWPSHSLLNPSASSYFDSQRSYCLLNDTLPGLLFGK